MIQEMHNASASSNAIIPGILQIYQVTIEGKKSPVHPCHTYYTKQLSPNNFHAVQKLISAQSSIPLGAKSNSNNLNTGDTSHHERCDSKHPLRSTSIPAFAIAIFITAVLAHKQRKARKQ
jgi:hypothetical protein